MPRIVADSVEAYVFRRMHARLQFLLLLRRPDVPLGNVWQSVSEKIGQGESAFAAAERGVLTRTGLEPTEAYSADYINQVYDYRQDTIVLAPVFAFAVPPHAVVTPSAEYVQTAWCERDEATARVLLAGERWAIRHIDDLLGFGGDDTDFYRVR